MSIKSFLKLFLIITISIFTFINYSFARDPVCPGRDVTVEYAAENASYCDPISIIQDDGGNSYFVQYFTNLPPPTNGSGLRTFPATVGATFKLTCYNFNTPPDISTSVDRLDVLPANDPSCAATPGTPSYNLFMTPNPATYPANVTFNLNHTNSGSCEVRDQNGRIFWDRNTALPSSPFGFTASVNPGTYTITVTCWTAANGGGTAGTPVDYPLTVNCPAGQTPSGAICVWSGTPIADLVVNKTTAVVNENYDVTLNVGKTNAQVNADSCEITENGVAILQRNLNLVSRSYYGLSKSTPGTYTYVATCWTGVNGAGTSVSTTKSITITNIVATPKPDLQVSSIWPSNPNPSATLSTNINYSVYNAGSVGTGIAFNNLLQVREQSNPGNITSVLSGVMPAIASLASRPDSIPYAFPAAGNYEYRVCADKTSQADPVGVIDEGANEGNNCSDTSGWTPITVGPPPAVPVPDLIPADITTFTAIAGASKNFTSLITNQGTAGTGAGFNNYLQIFNTGMSEIGAVNAGLMNALAANGGTGIASANFIFPAAGTYYVRFCTDKSYTGDPGVINEGAFENNNCANPLGVTVSPAPPVPAPDLIAADITTFTATAGTSKTFTSTISNQGTASTGGGFNNFMQIYDSGNNPIDYVSAGPMGALISGGSAVASASYTFPSQGAYFVRFCADKNNPSDAGLINEGSNEGNNCATPQIVTVAPVPKPDLEIGWASILLSDPTPVASVANTINFAVYNNPNTADAVGPFRNLVQVQDAGGNITDILAPVMNGIAQGETKPSSVPYTFPAAGTYQVRACADKSSQADAVGVIDEGVNEGNNCRWPWISVTVSAAPAPNLIANAMNTSDASPYVGDPVTFSTLIRNTGDLTAYNFDNFIQILDSTGNNHVLALPPVNIASLAPLATSPISKTYTFTTPGVYQVRACADKSDQNSLGTVDEGANEGDNCGATVTLNVTVAVPTGTLDANPTSCSIPNGQNTCDVNLTWTTSHPIGTSAVVRGYNPATLFNANNGTNQPTSVPYDPALPHQVKYMLYNNALELDYKYVIATCASGYWNGTICRAVPVPITINIISEPQAQIQGASTNAKLTWSSNSNSCEVWSRDTVPAKIGDGIRTGTGPDYNFTFTLLAGTPQFRTELLSTHLGANALGYDIKCRDTTDTDRTPKTSLAKVYTYKATSATFVGPDASGIMTIKCTPDYDYVELRKDNVTVTGYPKTFNGVNQTVASAYTFTPVNNANYILICKTESITNNIDYAFYTGGVTPGPGGNSLGLFGSISASNNTVSTQVLGAEDTITAISSDSKFSEIRVKANNHTSWTVDYYSQYFSDSNNPAGNGIYHGTSINSGSLPPELILDASGELNIPGIIFNTTLFPNGLTLKVKAGTNSSDKTLWIKLKTNMRPEAFFDYDSSPATIVNPDMIKITITCKNSDSWQMTHTEAGNAVIASGLTNSSGIYNYQFNYDLTSNQPTGNVSTLILTCTKAADNSTYQRIIPIPSRTPVQINSLTVLPSEITCPGGNTEATIQWTLTNTINKMCHIVPSFINSANTDTAQLPAISSMLAAPNYTSISNPGAGDGSLSSILYEFDASNRSIGKIKMSEPNLISNGKRAFYYSTKFTMECDKVATPQVYIPGSNTYSKRSVDLPAKCITQN